MKYLFLLVYIGLTVSQLQAQNCHYTLSGQVTDKNTKAPIVSAKVQIYGTDKIAYTDLYGKYALHDLCNDTLDLKISAKDAQELIIPVLIEGNTQQNVLLDRHSVSLGKLVIVGPTKIRKSATAQEQSISAKDIDNFSSAALGDALKQMAGVSTLNTGKNIVKPVVQGLSGSRVPVLNNGIRMEDQEWGADHAPNIDLNSAGKITVIKGASALQYGGDAIGGVVLVDKPDIPKKDSLYGKTILTGSTNGRGGTVSSSLTKSFASGWYVGLQGTYKNFGDYKAPDYLLSNTGNNERDFTVNFGLHKFHYGFDAYYSSFDSHLAILRASSTGSVTDLVSAINSREPLYIHDFTRDQLPPRQRVRHQLARLKAYEIFDGIGKLTLDYAYQVNNRWEYDIRRGKYKYKPAVDLNLKTHSAKANFDFNSRNDRELNIGVKWDYKKNFADPGTGVRRIIPDYKSFGLGAYATGHVQLDENWLIEAGLRYDFYHIDAKKYYNKIRWHNLGYDQDFSDLIIGSHGFLFLTHPVFSYNNISGTAGVKYKLGRQYAFRLNYALSNRAPNPSELFSDGLHHSAASVELGDLRLASEHSNKISLSFEKQEGALTFTIAPYLNYIGNYINIEPHGLIQTVRGAFLKYNYQQNNVRLLGLDADVNYKINQNFSYHGKFSTVDGRGVKTHRAIFDIPATHTRHAVTYQNHQWHDLTLTLHGDAVFKKKHYPDDNFTIKVLQNGSYQNELVDISTPPKGYFLTGLDASTVFHPFPRGYMEVRLSVENLFNIRYRDYLNRLRYFADNLGRNFTLQLKFTY